ncbi:MAG: ribose-phosphate diphosphokinase [Alphaproteobacteria bacterium]|nr:ribose-phosphate diphosphokinase [Alphaproteobacteria bacterium]
MPIYINDELVEAKQFAGGERNINIGVIETGDSVNVTAYLLNSDDIFDLLLTTDALRRRSADVGIDLTIPYFSYARQDRVCNPGEALSVDVMVRLVNSLNCNTVTVFDPHSQKTMDGLANARAITAADVIAQSPLKDLIKLAALELVAPDKGAITRTNLVCDALGGLPVHYCTKERDSVSHEITKTVISGDVQGKSLIIIDDICDGGRTFIQLGKALKEAGAKDVYLYVTHGIFMAGLEILKPAIDGIFCLHTYLKPEQRDSSFLNVLEDEMALRPLARFRAGKRSATPRASTVNPSIQL